MWIFIYFGLGFVMYHMLLLSDKHGIKDFKDKPGYFLICIAFGGLILPCVFMGRILQFGVEVIKFILDKLNA